MKKTILSVLQVIFYIAVVLLALTFVFGGFERLGEEIRRPAYEEGYERGYDAGYKDGYDAAIEDYGLN